MAEPGWHPDPYGWGAQRYYDGTRWTEHVIDLAGHQTIDHPPTAPPASAAGVPAHHGDVAHWVAPVGTLQGVAIQRPAMRNKGTAFLLTFLFGPFGMLYSTVSGAVVMIVVSLVLVPATLGLAALVLWPVSMIWGTLAVDSWNRQQLPFGGVAPVAFLAPSIPTRSVGTPPPIDPPVPESLVVGDGRFASAAWSPTLFEQIRRQLSRQGISYALETGALIVDSTQHHVAASTIAECIASDDAAGEEGAPEATLPAGNRTVVIDTTRLTDEALASLSAMLEMSEIWHDLSGDDLVVNAADAARVYALLESNLDND